MNCVAAIAAATGLLAASAPACIAGAQAAPSEERLSLAKELSDLTGQEAAVIQRFRPIVSGLKGSPAAEAIFHRHMPEIVEIIRDVYAREFSARQLRDLVAFYKSETGRAFSARQGDLSREFARSALPLMLRMADEVAAVSCKPPSCMRCSGPNCTPPPLMIKPVPHP